MRARSLQLDPYDFPLYGRLSLVARRMAKLGWFDNRSVTLYHLDLEPRNIMVQVGNDDDSIEITGILDWDSALFLPQFMGCCPPGWLWMPREDNEDDDDPDKCEDMAPETPSDPCLRERKAILEGIVGKRYRALSYPIPRRLMRKLCLYAISGLHSSWVVQAADDFATECFAIFDEIRKEKRRVTGKKRRSQRRQKHKRRQNRQREQGHRQ